MRNKGKIVLITGASSGLGKELSEMLGKEGYTVWMCARNIRKLENVMKELQKEGILCHSTKADISNMEDVTRLYDEIMREYGKLDILVNNAGIGLFGLLEEINYLDIFKTININVIGTIYMTKKAVNIMKKQKYGTIVNIISTAGKIPRAYETVYVASKWAQRGFFESLKLELKGSGIRVINIYPGGMRTSFWNNYIWYVKDVSKFMDPKDVAAFILKVIEEENIWVDDVTINRPK